MYETFFHFRQRPFLASPSIERYFPGQAIEHARQTLLRCVERAQGPGLLVGPTGTGKSLVCQMLADQLSGNFRVALLANTRLSTRRSLLQNVLFELGLSYRDLDEGEMRLSLLQHIEPSVECSQGLVLIVDEAQSLPLRLLEELRALTNVVRHGRSRVQLVLAGGSALEERFAHPKLESFNQRIAARCYLQAFNRSESYEYVRAQLASVDASAEPLFPAESMEAVFRATDGVPRLINQVCDLALLQAAQARRAVVDPGCIEAAWAELQQLPAPWQNPSSTPAAGASSGIIEFGSLDDDGPSGATPFANDESIVESPEAEDLRGDDFERAANGPVMAPKGEVEPVDLYARVTNVVVDSWLPELPESTAAAPMPPTAPASAPTPARAPAASLFGDGFVEEEVVLDHYASLALRQIESRLRVSCVEGREMAALLPPPATTILGNDVPAATDSRASAQPVEVPAGSAEDALLKAIRAIPPVDDPSRWTPGRLPDMECVALDPPVLSFEEAGSQYVLGDAESGARRPHLLPVPHDDRDLLIVEEEGSPPPPANPDQGRARRQDYRQLFSRLRRG